MAVSVEDSGSKLDQVKWLLVLALLGSGIYGFYYLADQSLLFRVIGLLAVFGVAVAVALQTAKGKATWEFAKGARTEIRKVVWPTRKETTQTTLIVMAVVALLSLFLWLIDMLLAWGIRFVIGGS